ncbi:MAG TPA: serine/threonine-protein kinase, partial [Polyangia bacterium]|nr:serine/threonine-protein kinase [Polyangia bacterium]
MLPGVVVGTRFEVESVAAVGGMGTVYRARDRADGQRVALKLMRGSELDRFVSEAEVLASLRHPHIVRYVAHGEAGPGELFIAMEWIDGEDLAARLRRAPLSIRESVIVARTVAAALAVAHARGVVHRDLKPSNLLIPDGDVGALKLVDFGVAYLDDARGGVVTRTGAILGTPSYMAPEQARGQHPLSPRADVFSLGAVLFEAIAGQPYLPERPTYEQTIMQLVSTPAPRLS